MVSYDHHITHRRVSPGDIVDMKPQKTQCIKHILEFYIGNGKGVATAPSILEHPIQLAKIQCKVMWMHFIKVLQFVEGEK